MLVPGRNDPSLRSGQAEGLSGSPQPLATIARVLDDRALG